MAEAEAKAGMVQTEAQRRAIGEGEEGGKPEPKSSKDWAERGTEGGEPGRSPPVPGGASQGGGDRADRSDGSPSHIDRDGGRPLQPRPGEG